MRVGGKEVSINPNESSKEQSIETMEKTVDKSKRRGQISEKMIEALVKQLGHELSNYHLYRTFANYFKGEGLPKLEQYFIGRANEENRHHNWIFWYLNYTNSHFTYPRIEAIEVDIKDRVYPFLATVDREIQTTEMIDEMINLAMDEKDWGTFNWIMGDSEEHGKLRKEQIEEESISVTIAKLAQEDTDWLTKQDSILEFYSK